MSREFFLECAVCDDSIFHYGELLSGEYRTIQTDRGNLLVCKEHSPASVKKMWARVRCKATLADGKTQCSQDANNVKPYHCARHGGGYK